MCMSAPSMPEMPKPEPLPQPKPLPMPQQASPPPPAAPTPPPAPMPVTPLPPPMPETPPAAPPPQPVTGKGAEDTAIVKRRKSKRQELQQASGGTDALRIQLSRSIGTGAKGNTGSTGLNIPK